MEAFVPRVTYATFGRRTWGLVLDVVIDLFVALTLNVIVSGEGAGALFLFWYLIHHVGLVVEGGSLGMRLVGLRVVTVEGERVTVKYAVIREVIRVCGSLPPLGLGFLWMLDQPERRTWHDLAARTVVVREGDPAVLVAPDWAGAPPWQAAAEPEPEPEPEPSVGPSAAPRVDHGA